MWFHREGFSFLQTHTHATYTTLAPDQSIFHSFVAHFVFGDCADTSKPTGHYPVSESTRSGINGSTLTMALSFLRSRKLVSSSVAPTTSSKSPTLASHVVAGYEAPLLWPVFFASLLTALLLNEYHQHVFYHQQPPPTVSAPALPHALVIAVSVALLTLHEAARPCAASLTDVGVLVVGAFTDATHAALFHVRRGFQPQFPGWSGAFHVFQAVLNTVSRTHGRNVIWLRNAQMLRRNAYAFGRVQGWLSCLTHGTTTERFHHIGLEHMWLRAKDVTRLSKRSFATTELEASQKLSSVRGRGLGESETDTDSDTEPRPSRTVDQSASEPLVVLYFHGGGYSSMSPDVYVDFCNRLRSQLDQELRSSLTVVNTSEDEDTTEASSVLEPPAVHVLIANYRKIPEVVYPVPADDCMRMYEHLTQDVGVPPHRIVLAGDSAGAGLVLSTLLRVRDANGELPLAAVCCCPWIDLVDTEAPAAHCILQPPVADGFRDFFQQSSVSVAASGETVEAWREAHAVDRDLSRLPPLLIQTGTLDVFHPHALRLAARAEQDNVRGCELDAHEDMPHVFAVIPPWLLPGATAGVTRMAQFLAKHAVKNE